MDSQKNRYIHPAILFFFVLIIYASIFHPDPLDNVMNRVNLAYAVVYDHTLAVDRYADNTVDEAYYKGHSYYSEAVGSVPFAVGVVAALRPFTGNKAPDPYRPWPLYFMTLLLSSIPAALLVVFVFQYAGTFVKDEKARLAAALAFGLGTIAFPYATLYYNALAAALLHAAAFLLIERVRADGNASAARLITIGLLSCFGVITQFDTVIIALGLFIYLAAGMRRPGGILFLILGAFPPAAMMLAYNAACFGSPFSFGLFHLASAKEWEHLIGAGIIGVTWPHPDRLLLLLFEPTRGLLWCSPFLVFAVPGFVKMFRAPELRARAALFAGIAVVYLLLNSSFPYFRGGASPGPRHLLPCLVFLSFPVAYWLADAPRAQRSVCVWLMAASAAAMLAVTLTCPHVPSEIKSPMWSAAVPLLRRGTVTSGMPDKSFIFEGLLLAATLIIYSRIYALQKLRRSEDKGMEKSTPSKMERLAPALYGFIAAAAFAAVSAALADTHTAAAAEFRAHIMLSFGNTPAAVREYEDLLNARPAPGKSSAYNAHMILGEYYESKLEASAALRHFQAAHQLFPDRIEPLIHTGNIHLGFHNTNREAENITRAVKIFEEIIQLDPGYAPALKTLAFIYMSERKYDDAARMARRMLARDPNNRQATQILSDSMRLLNREKQPEKP